MNGVLRQDFMLGAGFGLPAFLLIMFALSASSTRGELPSAFARRKARFLLLPWLRWSLIYVTLLIATDAARGAPLFGRLDASMLVVGGHPALWFLPLAWVALLAVRFVDLGLGAARGRRAAISWSLAVVLALAWVEELLPGVAW